MWIFVVAGDGFFVGVTALLEALFWLLRLDVADASVVSMTVSPFASIVPPAEGRERCLRCRGGA